LGYVGLKKAKGNWGKHDSSLSPVKKKNKGRRRGGKKADKAAIMASKDPPN